MIVTLSNRSHILSGCCSGARLFPVFYCGARLFVVCCPSSSCFIRIAVSSLVLPPPATSPGFPPMIMNELRTRVYIMRALCLLICCCSGARLLLGCCSGVKLLLICCGRTRLQLFWCVGARLRLGCCLCGNIILMSIRGALFQRCCGRDRNVL